MTEKQERTGLLLSALVLFGINVLNFYDRNALGALVEPLRKEFHLTDAQNGFLSSAFVWVYAIVGLPLGWLADSRSRKKLLAGAVFVWASLTACAGFATSFALLLISRLGVGVGEAACAPVGTSWLGDLFPPEKRSRALAFFMLGVPIGGALGFFLTGPIAQAYGWRRAIVVAAAPALLLIPALLALREPKRGAAEVRKTPLGRGSVWSVLRIRTFWWIIASGALLNFNMYVVGTFLPAFFSRVHHLSLALSNVATGVVYLLGGVSGGLLAGHLGDSVFRQRKDGRLRLSAVMVLLAAPLALLGFLQPQSSRLLAIALLVLVYGAMTTYYGFVYSSLHDIVSPGQRGTAMAVYFFGMYLCGASYGPLLTGRLSDHLAHRAAGLAGSAVVTEAFRAIGLQRAMLVIPAFCIPLAFVLYMASRTIIADIEARHAAEASAPHSG
ncbi:MAG TPA: MFS transporter [Candidatus Acidoferrum sp.]|nr:MFS transporter [Candidatus Acidoferrum sp.]